VKRKRFSVEQIVPVLRKQRWEFPWRSRSARWGFRNRLFTEPIMCNKACNARGGELE
jgi:hypothetical protein